jgi:hypothetical protein
MTLVKTEDFIVPLTPPSLLEFIGLQREKITLAVIAQVELILLVMAIVSVTAILTGLLVWKSNSASEALPDSGR